VKFSEVSDLHGVIIPVFPLTLLGHRYNSSALLRSLWYDIVLCPWNFHHWSPYPHCKCFKSS